MDDGELEDENVGQDENAMRQQGNQKEAVLYCSALFCMLAMVGIIFFWDTSDLEAAVRWGNMECQEATCHIDTLGVAYRGNCDMHAMLQMTHFNTFAECMGPGFENISHEVSSAWTRNQQSHCTRVGDLAYSSPELWNGTMVTKGRRLRIHVAHHPLGAFPVNRVLCHNTYLAWAFVRVNTSSGIPRCAYEYGAAQPSLSGDWEKISKFLKKLKQQRTMKCWTLGQESCIVGFYKEDHIKDHEVDDRYSLQITGIVCAVISVILGCAACCLHIQERGFYHMPAGGMHHLIPTEDPDEHVLLSSRVRRAVRHAVHNLNEQTPQTSRESTARALNGDDMNIQTLAPGGRKLIIPRNIAADFLHANRN